MRPPPSTRSYKTVARMNAGEHFNLDVYLTRVLGYPDRVETVRKAAAVMSAYDVTRGTRTPFPSAFHFVEEHFGMKSRDPASKATRGERYYSIWLLRTAFKLREYTERLGWPSFTVTMVRCPKCGEDTIETMVGKLPKLRDEHKRMVSLKVQCTCKKFQTTDYYAIETLALSEIT